MNLLRAAALARNLPPWYTIHAGELIETGEIARGRCGSPADGRLAADAGFVGADALGPLSCERTAVGRSANTDDNGHH